MSEFVSLSINTNAKVGCAVEPLGSALTLPATGAGGWGLGYFRSGRLLLRIEPRDRGEELDVARILTDLQADVLLLHSREATMGPVGGENTHPFKFHDWLFAHNGTVAGFVEFKEKLLDAMPPFIQRSLRGETDSEHLFHLFLSFLYDSGRLSRSDPGTSAIREALTQAVATVDTFAQDVGRAPSPLSAVVSDGYSLVVLGRGIPVYYTLIEGVRDCGICRVSRISMGKPQQTDHEDLRAVLIRSGTAAVDHSGFQLLDDNTFLSVTKSQRIEFDRSRQRSWWRIVPHRSCAGRFTCST
jgi:glutamine amidotransferase